MTNCVSLEMHIVQKRKLHELTGNIAIPSIPKLLSPLTF
jgi:hypothetical protein